ncbi:MAG: transcriptional regulator [Rhodospirillum sp.]|nr:transcriptional regulator [Rhodospirillum sp.]MCF8489430.1 transcriptional regulator [Rhodospirillum sp.]MCF8502789.1 transcriptional regulator [Rhodospirillum sp.]
MTPHTSPTGSRPFSALRFSGIFLAAALLWLALPAPLANAAELLFVEQPGCPWCAKVRRDILPAWAGTKEGKRVPMRRVDIAEGWPEDLSAIPREHLTPTFILVENGRELARLRGYPGEHFIWPMLGQLIESNLPSSSGPSDSGLPPSGSEGRTMSQ